jgi:uncharacterized membrane protein YdjX (TVP38/TMEM64 family)
MSVEARPTGQQPPAATAETGAEPELKPSWRKVLLLAVVVCGLLAVVYLSPLREYLGRLHELSDYLRGLGFLAPLVLTLSVAVLVAVGFPRLLFCVIAGMALGFWSGLLWTQLGTLLGNYAVFLMARYSAREWMRRYLSKRSRLQRLIRREVFAGVILARQLPVPGLLVNLGCGLLAVRHRHFLVGTAVGQLPEAIPCTLIGAGVLGASFAKSVGAIGVAVVLAVAVWLGLRWALKSKS